MKTPAVVLTLLLVSAVSPVTAETTGKLEVTTSKGRTSPVTRIYSIKEIEEGVAAYKAPANKFDVNHPVFPQMDQLSELKQHVQPGDEIWYFYGFDSGWAVVRHGKVAWVLVTNHEW